MRQLIIRYLVVEILVLVSSWLLCLEKKNGSTSTGRGNVAPSRKIVYYPPSFVCWIVSVNRNVSFDSLVLVPGDSTVPVTSFKEPSRRVLVLEGRVNLGYLVTLCDGYRLCASSSI